VARPGEANVRPIFEAAFQEHGLPRAIGSDNGPPFASPGVGGLSRLAVWWIKLGIRSERIVAGKPQQNGRHERVHRTLKQETAAPPADSLVGEPVGVSETESGDWLVHYADVELGYIHPQRRRLSPHPLRGPTDLWI
jgi:transposase InsO family protein